MTFVGGHEHASTPPREAASSPERGAHSPMDAARKTSSPAVGSFGASARIGRTAPARASVRTSAFRPVPADRLARQIPARRPGMFYICSVKPTARSPCPLPSVTRRARSPPAPGGRPGGSARQRRSAGFFALGAARKSLKSPTSHGEYRGNPNVLSPPFRRLGRKPAAPRRKAAANPNPRDWALISGKIAGPNRRFETHRLPRQHDEAARETMTGSGATLARKTSRKAWKHGIRARDRDDPGGSGPLSRNRRRAPQPAPLPSRPSAVRS
ncbi:hypothetical protein DFR50_10784 [Roseiarcus fermentans]|uniref:Uncharacterized protein n=1 Tax=Roseiarcus fermentans TaxID=1473586 RepID=A0A366FMA2_9HYPH|nr:hypothetical protein DFR50_10784 [Roseiarcus fermentans]